ncbi:MAG: protein kinase [Desulfobacterales bacterium]|nr:protein kinase [Desulfobacterales bacterium]
MAAKKMNCWEFMKCGREPGGSKAAKLGTCVAATDSSYDGINTGKNAGRICWAVAGTCCGGEIQGTFAEKRDSCTSCPFYRTLQKEEGTSAANHKLFNYFSEEDRKFLASKVTCKIIEAGERLITQGDVQQTAYIIQRGACLLVVEKQGQLHPVGHLGRGDIVGIRSFLTGEPQSAHVEAETVMEVWALDKSLFDNISKEDPELLEFLTELVANRFDSKRPTADRVIGKYTAMEIIGRGAYSIVYKGINTDLSMPVAIKMLRHNLAMDPEFISGFRNEAKIIASLRHDNILRVYDIEERFNTVFIIEEMVEGESLASMLCRLKCIPPKSTISFLMQLCSGLQYAHKKGVIHRDINPSNVFVQQGDRLKLLDFGLSCPIGTEDFGSFGTLAYMAPEQIESEPMDQRTDIYALGITAFEMLAGQNPFTETDARKLIDLHLNCGIPDPADVVPNIPETLRQFILKACKRNPGQRYQSVAEALEDLKHLAPELGIAGKHSDEEKMNMTSLFIVYKENQQPAVKQLMESLRVQAKELGIDLKSADLSDL